MSDYLDEEEQVARLKSWWSENGTGLVVAAVVSVAAIVGWNWYQSASTESAHDATRVYQQYQQGEGDPAVSLSELGQNYAGSGAHTLAVFAEAKAAMDAGDFSKAKDLYARAIDEAEHALLMDLGRIRLARVQQELDLSTEALATLALVKNSGFRSLALELTGDIHSANGDVEQANAAYQAAVNNLIPGDTRPFLRMKLENTAPFEGQFVQMTNTRAEALKDAEQTLREVAESLPATDAEDSGADPQSTGSESIDVEIPDTDQTESEAESEPSDG